MWSQRSRSRPARGAWVEIERDVLPLHHPASRAPQGARGLKFVYIDKYCKNPCRAPQGARGLKFHSGLHQQAGHPSRPARGAWVEIQKVSLILYTKGSRAPQGARGLKSESHTNAEYSSLSRPARGAWVEIFSPAPALRRLIVSRPARGAWVEIAV